MRPKKRKRVCDMPNYRVFGPLNGKVHDEIIILSVEEYEVIRLIDLEGLEQQQCAERMEVGRSTVQRMYSDAKRKVADSLVNGKILKIEGGDYFLCGLENNYCTNCNRKSHGHGSGHRRGKMC